MPVVVNLSGLASASPFWQTLLSSAIASTITFAGALAVVWYSNKYASQNLRAQRVFDERRFRRQREHEAAEAVKERITQNRRDVCLHTFDSLARIQAHMVTLASRFEDYDNQPLQNFLAAAAQAELVLEPATALAMRQLVSQVGRLHLEIMIKRVPLQRLHNELVKAQASERSGTRVNPGSAEIEGHFNTALIPFYRYMLGALRVLISGKVSALIAVRRDLELSAEDAATLQDYWVKDGQEILDLFNKLVAEAQR